MLEIFPNISVETTMAPMVNVTIVEIWSQNFTEYICSVNKINKKRKKRKEEMSRLGLKNERYSQRKLHFTQFSSRNY